MAAWRAVPPHRNLHLKGLPTSVHVQGDKVFACSDSFFPHIADGCCAEFASGAEAHLARMPDHISFEEAAVIPLVALTAWQVHRWAGRGSRGPCPSGQVNLAWMCPSASNVAWMCPSAFACLAPGCSVSSGVSRLPASLPTHSSMHLCANNPCLAGCCLTATRKRRSARQLQLMPLNMQQSGGVSRHPAGRCPSTHRTGCCPACRP